MKKVAVKHLLPRMPKSSSFGRNIKFLLARIIHSRFTFIFFIVSILNVATQISLQSFLLKVDMAKIHVIESFANLPKDVFVSLDHGNTLKACNEETDLPPPNLDGTIDCPVVYVAGLTNSSTVPVAAPDGSSHSLCDLVLLWPYQTFRNEARTDGAMIGMGTWLIIVSTLAILNESTAHLVAAMLMQVMSSVWSAFAIFETQRHRAKFEEIVINGACKLYSKDPGFLGSMPALFQQRLMLDVLACVVNFILLSVLSVLSVRIYKVFREQQFERVGASEHVQSIYKFVLWLSASFQLSAFILLISIALWIDQLFGFGMYILSEHLDVYRGIFIGSLVMLLPWLVLGHHAVRKENKYLMIAFLGICVAFIICWAYMFGSATYRVTFVTWGFFATTTVTGMVLLVTTFIIGVLCFRNFGKGLVHYLHVKRVLADSDFPVESFNTRAEREAPTMKSFLQRPEPIRVNLTTVSATDYAMDDKGVLSIDADSVKGSTNWV